MHRLFRMILLACLLLSLIGTAAYAKPIQVFVQKNEVTFDAEPFVENGRTLVPLRAIAQSMGFSVAYEPSERRVTLSDEKTTVVLWIDSQKVLVNGQEGQVDVPPMVKNGRTYVPVRFLAEKMGAEVGWNAQEQRVQVTPGIARALMMKSLAKQNGVPNQKSNGKIGMTVKMEGMPADILSFTMDMDMHIHDQTLLSTYTAKLQMVGGNGEPIVGQIAIKDGRMYMQDPKNPHWVEVGKADLKTGMDLSAITGQQSLIDPLSLQESSYANAVITLGGGEVLDDVPTTKIDVVLDPKSMAPLLKSILASQANTFGLNDLSMDHSAFSFSAWIDPETGFTHKTTIDFRYVLSTPASDQVPVMRFTAAISGEIFSRPTNEPVVIPGLP